MIVSIPGFSIQWRGELGDDESIQIVIRGRTSTAAVEERNERFCERMEPGNPGLHWQEKVIGSEGSEGSQRLGKNDRHSSSAHPVAAGGLMIQGLMVEI